MRALSAGRLATMQLGRRKACLSLSGNQLLYARPRTEAIEISQDSVTAGCVFAQLRAAGQDGSSS